MKRFMSVILAAVLSLAMVTTAFADNDALTVLNTVNDKNNQLDSIDTDMTIRASMYQGRENIDMIMQANIKMENMTGGDMRYLMDTFLVMGIPGEDENMTGNATMFYKDGYYYIDMMGIKMKYPMPLDSMRQAANQATGTQFTPEQFKDVQMRSEGDNLILTYEMDTAQLNAVMDQALAGMLNTMGGQIHIKSMSGEYTVNPEGYYTAMKIIMAMDMTAEGETMSMVLAMDGTVNNPGQPVHIQFPSTEGYESLSDMLGVTGSGGGPASDY